ncbi:MAG: hypothetical protein AB8H80_17695, partial [Planctomycetota bacterium]
MRRWVWTAGSGFTETASLELSPSPADPRGGYGIVGLHVADLLPGNGSDEVIVTTLAGDLFVYDESLSNRLFRTHVPGSLGAHNAIRVVDLDN